MIRPDEAVLAQWIAQEDHAAYVELVSRHGAMLFSAARRLTRQESQAAKALQAAYRELPQLLSKKSGAVVVGLHQHLVKQSRSSKRGTLKPRAAVQKQPTWNDIAPFLDEAIAALPAKTAAPVILRYLESHPEADMAHRLDLDRISANTLLEKGLASLCRSLNRSGFSITPAVLKELLEDYLIEPSPTAVITELQALGESLLEGVENAGDDALLEAFEEREAPAGPTAKTKLIVILIALICCTLIAGVVLSLVRTKTAPPSIKAQKTQQPAQPSVQDKTNRVEETKPEENLVSQFVDKIEEPSAWTPPRFHPFTSEDIPPENGVHFFFVAAEIMPKIKLDRFFSLWKAILAGHTEDLEEFLELLERFRPSLEAIRTGLNTGHCALPALRGFGDKLPHDLRWVQLARIMDIEAQLLCLDGAYPAALESFMATLDFINESTRKGGVDQVRRGFFMANSSLEALRKNLSHEGLLPEDYHHLSRQLLDWSERRYGLWEAAALETEQYRDWFEAVLEAEGDFSLIPSVLGSPPKGVPPIPPMSPEQAQNEFAQAIEDYEAMQQYFNWPFYDTTTLNLDAILLNTPVLQHLLPPFEQLYAAETRLLTQLEGLRHIAALEACYREQASYPTDLGELVPAYLPVLSEDPFSGGAFLYTATESGYLLYSTGMDLVDNQGRNNAWNRPGGDLIIFRRKIDKRDPRPQAP